MQSKIVFHSPELSPYPFLCKKSPAIRRNATKIYFSLIVPRNSTESNLLSRPLFLESNYTLDKSFMPFSSSRLRIPTTQPPNKKTSYLHRSHPESPPHDLRAPELNTITIPGLF